MTKIFKKIFFNKVFIFCLIAFFLIGGYFLYTKHKANQNKTRYVIERLKKGSIQKTVSGSGYIINEDQVDIKSKVGGEVIEVLVQNNELVKKDQVLVKIDPESFKKQVEDAEFSLKMAQLNLDKLISSKEQTINDLNKAYETSFQNLSAIYGNLPDLITSLKNIFDTKTITSNNDLKDLDFYNKIVSFYRNLPYIPNQQYNTFYRLLNDYYKVFKDYQLLYSPLDQKKFEEILNNSYNFIKNLFELTKTNRDNLSAYKDLYDNYSISTEIPISTTNSQLSTLQQAVSSLNSYLNTLISDKNTIDKYKTTLKNYEQDILNQEYTIKQKENALKDAKNNLANCFIKAPFNGIITNIKVKRGDLISANTVIGTLITQSKIAQITLSEIDAALVEKGQEVNLTLDALPNIVFKGVVTEVGLLGETSQGVVLYPVKISFLSNKENEKDLEKIKTGMTVDATIIVEKKENVLVVPVSAVKSLNERKYIEIPQEKDLELIKNQKLKQVMTVSLYYTPKRVFITTGLSDENYIEILSGLNEGEFYIKEVISPTSKTQNTRNTFFTPQFRMPTGSPNIRQFR